MKYKYKQKTKMIAAGLVAGLSLVAAPSAMAWGPERPTYTNAAPADHVTFNSITDNPRLGDERDFVRVVEVKEDGEAKDTYSNDLTLEVGKEYEVMIYYHNNASGTYNDKAHDYVGVARKARLVSDFPDELVAGERGQISAIISAENASPQDVWDEAYVTAKENMTLHFVVGSAKIQNDWDTNGSVLSTAIFDSEGVYLGVNELNGIVLGCYEYSGVVTYRFETEAVDGPVVPPSTPSEDEEMPEALPTTGPIEIALAVVVIIALVAGIVYWQKSSKEVKRVAHSARGKRK